MKLIVYSRDSFDFSRGKIVCELDLELKDKKACINFILKVDNHHQTGNGWYVANKDGLIYYSRRMYTGIPDFIQFIKRREEIGIWRDI